jgi:hypothetical protein
MPRTHLAIAVVLLAASPFLHSQLSVATNSPNGAPLSQRVVDYNIDARLDTDHKTLEATETLTYHNLTGQPLTTFPFHLYLNAFRPESTFTTGTRRYGGVRGEFAGDYYPPEKLGEITISHIDADSYGDLTSTLHFTAPDDGNMDDHTVAEIALPRPLPAGESITFHIAFHDKFPLSVARNGYKRDFVMGAQWFPKVGVFWHGAWNCHQYHATTEFFSDFGTYTVRLTLPRKYVVGASGVPTSSVINQDGTRTLGYYGEDIHDFAFAASPNFVVTDGTYLSSLGPVQVHVLGLAAHPGIGPRYLDITIKAMQRFEQWYGPYPYKIITVIDPEPGSQMQGMEYATLFTGDGSWFGPLKVMELTVVHEFGHQYWQGMVATNEFEEAWLDEGINSYSEVKALADIIGPNTSALDRRWANLGDAGHQRISYLLSPDYDPVSRFAWKFRDFESYAGVTYGKSATLLATLESIIGHDTMGEAMRTYFERYRFTHPTAEDFLRTIEEVAVARGKAVRLTPAPVTPAETAPGALNPYSFIQTGTTGNPTTVTAKGTSANPENVIPSGASRNAIGGVEASAILSNQAPPLAPSPPTTSTNSANFATAPVVNSSLRPYINQAVYGTELLDYTIDHVTSSPVRWWEPIKKDSQFIDIVYLHRTGNFVLPLTVQINFTDGTHVREQWDGADRWTRFSYTRNARIASAEIDPDHVTLLDKNFFNNSYSTHPNPVPARKLTNLWLALQQLAAQLFAWMV